MDTDSQKAGYETTDVSPRGIALAVTGVAVMTAVVFGLILLTFRFLGSFEGPAAVRRAGREPGAGTRVHLSSGYNGPLLQARPEEDLKTMRAHDAAELGSYGWIDSEAGVVRIPIDRAMDLIVQRGLPPVSPGKTLEEIQEQRSQPQVIRQNLPR